MIRKKQITFERMIAVAIMTLCFLLTGHAVCLGQKIVLNGKVIAYENSVLRVTRLTDVQREETFFVKVESMSKGKERSKFIIVKYRYLGENNALPESLFEGKYHWRFVLKRNRRCDQNGVGKNAAISIVKINENEGLPQTAIFPCYILVKKKLKAIKS